MGGSLRSKYYPWSREYYRRLYNTYPHMYPINAYPWRSSSLDSLELDKYYDSHNLDDKTFSYDPVDPLYTKYKRIAKTNPPNSDLLSKLKDFVFEQERQMTTDLLRKITEDKKIRSTDRPNLYSRESKSLGRYDSYLKNDPPFLNPINKKDNFYKRYNAFIKKILKPLRKSSPVKYEPEPPKTPRIAKTTSLSPAKTNYLSNSYVDDYYFYPSQLYSPYWNRYSSYPHYRRYLYDYLPKLQPASVPLDVESIIRKLNIEDENYKPLKKNYVPPKTYKYDPFESDSYLRSSLPTWKQYYYTQKLRSKPSNECFLDYYDPYYDFFPDRASADSTDDMLEDAPAELSDDPNQIVDEYRDAIYEDIIQNLREKQSKRNENTPLRADRKLFGYRANDRAEPYFSSVPYSNLYHSTYTPNVYRPAESYPQRFPTYGYYSSGTPKTIYSKANLEQRDTHDRVNDSKGSEIPDIAADIERSDFSREDYYKTKLDDSKILPSDTQTRQNVVSPSMFHTKCTTPVDNSFNKYSTGNLSPTKTKAWNTDGKLSPRNTEDASQDKKLERYKSGNASNKTKSSPSYDENKQKYDTEPKRISETKANSFIDEYKADTCAGQYTGQYKSGGTSAGQYDIGLGQYKPNNSTSRNKGDTSPEYKPGISPTRFALSKLEDPQNEYQSFPTVEQQSDKFLPTNSPTKPLSLAELRRSNNPFENELPSDKFTPITSPTKPQAELRRPSNFPSENEFTKTVNPVPSDNDKFQRKSSVTDKNRESLTNEALPESRFKRLSSSGSFGAGNREPSDLSKYSSDPAQRQNSPTAKKQARSSTSEAAGWQKDRHEPRQESSDPAPENIRRYSATRSRQLTPTERSTLSRRNSIVFDPNKSSTSQSASRKNSIKPLQRRNSIQPASEKRNILQKMNQETKYDGDEQPPVSNENSAESYSIEEQAEEVPYRSLTQFQKNLSKDDVFSGVDELAQKNMDSAKHNTYIGDDHRSVYQYDLNSDELNKALEKTSAPLPQTNYHDENPSSYEENSKDSYGRDAYNAKEQQFYPEYNYNEDTKYDSTIPRGSYSEQTNQADINSSLDDYQRSHTRAESSSKDYSGYDCKPAPSNVSDDKSSQDQPQSGLFDSYGNQEPPSLVSQSSNDSRSRRSFQQSDENADASLSTNNSPVRSYEPKEQEQSLNSINEELEKVDDKAKQKDSTKIQPTSTESTAAATASTKPKRSVDYGRSTISRELSRRPSRSALLSQSSDDRKLKNQSSAGELQKRMSKPKIGESKLRRTTSTFKVKPTAAAKKT